MLYKITNIKHLTSKEEASMIHALANELSNSKQSNQLSINLLNENYEKWVMAKIKRKHVYELYK